MSSPWTKIGGKKTVSTSKAGASSVAKPLLTTCPSHLQKVPNGQSLLSGRRYVLIPTVQRSMRRSRSRHLCGDLTSTRSTEVRLGNARSYSISRPCSSCRNRSSDPFQRMFHPRLVTRFYRKIHFGARVVSGGIGGASIAFKFPSGRK
jgi:hypothetical protein